MNCLEAQSLITAFIENTLNDDTKYEFIQHILNCPNCKEELEVYYILIVGMKQLDNNEKLSSDFQQDLDEKLHGDLEQIKSKRRLVLQTKIGACVLIFLLGAFTLFKTAELVGIIHTDDQEEEQSPYYYTLMRPYLFTPEGTTLRNPYEYGNTETELEN